MNKYSIILLLFLTACWGKDPLIEVEISEIPKALQIDDVAGLKLESFLVTDKVSMNVKLPEDGTYRIKIRDFSNKIVSQEKLTAKKGDNILKVYVNSLNTDSYTIELTNDNHVIIGRDVFGKQ
jgi:hypothetical protein